VAKGERHGKKPILSTYNFCGGPRGLDWIRNLAFERKKLRGQPLSLLDRLRKEKDSPITKAEKNGPQGEGGVLRKKKKLERSKEPMSVVYYLREWGRLLLYGMKAEKDNAAA